MSIKKALFDNCELFVAQRLQTIKTTIADIQNSLLSETKSSAGDKHETGRAMLQLEREKAGQQLAEIQKVKQILAKIDVEKTTPKIGLGSVVYTSNVNYFIAVSAGALEVDGTVFYAISAATPIARLLLSQSEGATLTFGERSFKILKIL
jgi:transcription elongation GreA/GreB family factor